MLEETPTKQVFIATPQRALPTVNLCRKRRFSISDPAVSPGVWTTNLIGLTMLFGAASSLEQMSRYGISFPSHVIFSLPFFSTFFLRSRFLPSPAAPLLLLSFYVFLFVFFSLSPSFNLFSSKIPREVALTAGVLQPGRRGSRAPQRPRQKRREFFKAFLRPLSPSASPPLPPLVPPSPPPLPSPTSSSLPYPLLFFFPLSFPPPPPPPPLPLLLSPLPPLPPSPLPPPPHLPLLSSPLPLLSPPPPPLPSLPPPPRWSSPFDRNEITGHKPSAAPLILLDCLLASLALLPACLPLLPPSILCRLPPCLSFPSSSLLPFPSFLLLAQLPSLLLPPTLPSLLLPPSLSSSLSLPHPILPPSPLPLPPPPSSFPSPPSFSLSISTSLLPLHLPTPSLPLPPPSCPKRNSQRLPLIPRRRHLSWGSKHLVPGLLGTGRTCWAAFADEGVEVEVKPRVRLIYEI
ncbi:hypothetical protein C7M84_020417 [Penaeus vannamei]|uniref:Uncharacterized protein n=1 Tax=Penaeus vannamei TaxID=6689 RepID=A0A423SC25_PENVA|nr:hypothetical protein C7M84_020417 [Penaeus vannamei]